MKIELITWAAASVMTAAAADAVVTPEQAVMLWSAAGTICGSVLSVLSMPPNAKAAERALRAATSFCAGLIVAPLAVSLMPVSAAVPSLWLAFGTSGIAAFAGYIIVAEGQVLMRDWLQSKRANPPDPTPRRRKSDAAP